MNSGTEAPGWVASAAFWALEHANGDRFVAVAFLTGIFFMLLAVVFGGRVLAQQRLRAHAAHVQRRVREAWRPVLASVVATGVAPERLPRLSRGERFDLIVLWAYWVGLSSGGARKALIAFGSSMEFASVAATWLRLPWRRSRRLLALDTLGYLHSPAAWPAAQRLLGVPDAPLSLACARCLLQIDPLQAMPLVLARAVSPPRPWSPRDLQQLLSAVPVEHVREDLWRIAEQSPPAQQAGLLEVVVALDPVAGRALLDAVLETANAPSDAPVLATALKLLEDPRDAALARRFLAHEDWHVRLQATRALGRLGLLDDVPLLVSSLSDSAWWVRLRAAQALLALPGMRREAVSEVASALSDPYAQDVLRRALSEQEGSQALGARW